MTKPSTISMLPSRRSPSPRRRRQPRLAQLGGNADQPVEQNPLYLQAKAAVDNAQRELDDTVVRAPFDGIITNVSVASGWRLPDGRPAGFLAGFHHQHVDQRQPKETELTYVRPGQKVFDLGRCLSGRYLEGHRRQHLTGLGRELLAAAGAEHHWQLGQGRAAHSDDHQHRRHAGKPPLRVGMSVVADVDTGHARGLPDAIAGLLGKSHGQDHE